MDNIFLYFQYDFETQEIDIYQNYQECYDDFPFYKFLKPEHVLLPKNSEFSYRFLSIESDITYKCTKLPKNSSERIYLQRHIKEYLIKNQKTVSIEILNNLVKFDKKLYKHIVYDEYILNNIYKSDYFYKWYKPKSLKETLIKNINLKKIEYKNYDMLMKY